MPPIARRTTMIMIAATPLMLFSFFGIGGTGVVEGAGCVFMGSM
jgi:hypothetical protein